MEQKDIKRGKFYYSCYNKLKCEYIMEAKNDGDWITNHHIQVFPDKSVNYLGTGSFNTVGIDREAIPEEQYWLEQCILVGKGIRKEDLPKIENSYQIY
jgi:hypothetical protein